MQLTKVYRIDGLDCAVCADKVQANVNSLSQVSSADIDFLSGRFTVTVREEASETVWDDVLNAVNATEPEAVLQESKPASAACSNCSDEDSSCARAGESPYHMLPQTAKLPAALSIPLRISLS